MLQTSHSCLCPEISNYQSVLIVYECLSYCYGSNVQLQCIFSSVAYFEFCSAQKKNRLFRLSKEKQSFSISILGFSSNITFAPATFSLLIEIKFFEYWGTCGDFSRATFCNVPRLFWRKTLFYLYLQRRTQCR